MTHANRSMPPSVVIPVLIYPDVREAVDWLVAAFGFAERVWIGDNHRAQLNYGGGGLIVGDVRHSRADCSLARADLDWSAKIPFEDGLARTVAWLAEAN